MRAPFHVEPPINVVGGYVAGQWEVEASDIGFPPHLSPDFLTVWTEVRDIDPTFVNREMFLLRRNKVHCRADGEVEFSRYKSVGRDGTTVLVWND